MATYYLLYVALMYNVGSIEVYRVELHHKHKVMLFVRIRRPPRSTLDRSSAASDVYKRQAVLLVGAQFDDADLVDRPALVVSL